MSTNTKPQPEASDPELDKLPGDTPITVPGASVAAELEATATAVAASTERIATTDASTMEATDCAQRAQRSLSVARDVLERVGGKPPNA